MSKGGYKIYFSASIAAGRADAHIYSSLVDYLEENYGTVLDKHVGDLHLTVEGEGEVAPTQIHDQDLEWLLEADVLIAEVSTPSLGVGYEIGRFVEHLPVDDPTKRLLCLHRPGKILSAMINGCPQALITNYQSIEEAYRHIDAFFLSSLPRKLNK